VQISLRQCEKFLKRAGMLDDAEDRTARTMPSQTTFAPIARSAAQVNLADDPPSDEFGIVRLDYFADKFMSRNSGKSVVAALKFEVGVADPSAK
jgi:hypothetical protein